VDQEKQAEIWRVDLLEILRPGKRLFSKYKALVVKIGLPPGAVTTVTRTLGMVWMLFMHRMLINRLFIFNKIPIRVKNL